MTILSINHINIRAAQPLLDRLRDFYRDVLGLSEGYRPPFAGFGYWLYAGDQPLIHLYEALPGRHVPHAEPGAIDHFAFTCADRAGFEARLDRLGIRYDAKFIPATGHGQIFLIDPAGNRVELQFDDTALSARSED
jgi:catechol 2,3-dioxygenase-like lactoylglutathione lyase family enzyme